MVKARRVDGEGGQKAKVPGGGGTRFGLGALVQVIKRSIRAYGLLLFVLVKVCNISTVFGNVVRQYIRVRRQKRIDCLLAC